MEGLMSVGGYTKKVAVAQLSKAYSSTSGYIDWGTVPKASWSTEQVPVNSNFFTMDSEGALTCKKTGKYHFVAMIGAIEYRIYGVRAKINESVVYTAPNSEVQQGAPRMLDYTENLKPGDSVKIEYRANGTISIIMSLMIWKE